MSEPPLRELQPASDNPWYRLATARQDHAANRDLWNGYMRHLIGEEEADNLKRGDGTPIELPLLSPDEIRRIEPRLPFPPRELPSKDLSVWPAFRRGRKFPRLLLSRLPLTSAEAPSTEDPPTSQGKHLRGICHLQRQAPSRERPPSEASTFAGEATFSKQAPSRNMPTSRASTFTGHGQLRENHLRGIWPTSGKAPSGKVANFREKHLRGKMPTSRKSTFGGYADFAESIFTGYADFDGKHLRGICQTSQASTFAGDR